MSMVLPDRPPAAIVTSLAFQTGHMLGQLAPLFSIICLEGSANSWSLRTVMGSFSMAGTMEEFSRSPERQ